MEWPFYQVTVGSQELRSLDWHPCWALTRLIPRLRPPTSGTH